MQPWKNGKDPHECDRNQSSEKLRTIDFYFFVYQSHPEIQVLSPQNSDKEYSF